MLAVEKKLSLASTGAVGIPTQDVVAATTPATEPVPPELSASPSQQAPASPVQAAPPEAPASITVLTDADILGVFNLARLGNSRIPAGGRIAPKYAAAYKRMKTYLEEKGAIPR